MFKYKKKSDGKVYRKIRKSLVVVFIVMLSLATGLSSKMPVGIGFQSEAKGVSEIEFIYDLTYQKDGKTIREQNIFEEELEMIKNAEQFIVMDLFLFNSYYDHSKYEFPEISNQLVEAIIEKKKAAPDMKIIFITDEINNFYGGYEAENLALLKANDVDVVITDVKKLRDSNPLYSGFWRIFVDWTGEGEKGWLKNPFSADSPKVTIRSYLKSMNFKANHRKVIITENEALITSMNPHDASAYHSNIAFKVRGEIINDFIESEKAVAKFSGYDLGNLSYKGGNDFILENIKVSLLTEKKIKESLIEKMDETMQGDRIHIGMFYLCDRQVVEAIVNASNRGVNIRLVLDPNKDAFGFEKKGIPNRSVANELKEKTEGEIGIRWYDTKGEQYHTKMIMIEQGENVYIIGGSANLTRRNLDNYNLESDLMIETNKEDVLAKDISAYFDRIYENREGSYTVGYDVYAEQNLVKYLTYRIQEKTGLSTF